LLDNFPEIVRRLKGMLERFMQALSCIDQCFIGDEMLERLPLASRVGKSMVGGIDLNKPRLRHVAAAVVALSASPDGFTASALADQVRASGDKSVSVYGPRQAAYDLQKLRGQEIVQYSATIRTSGRIASSRNAPERTGHCLTRMLPSARHIVNRVAQNPAFLFDRRTCFPVPTWRRPSRGAQRRGLGGAEPPGATRSAPLRASMARMASTGPSPK
jgi:hypothetical protein